MNYLDKEQEREEIQKLIEQDKEDDSADFRQYGFLKWGKVKNFEEIIKDVCAKTRTKIPKVMPYKLRIYTAWCNGDRISYHPIRISKLNYKGLLHIVAHELGHIRCCGGDRATREYKAELFALKITKKHYSKYFTLAYTKAMIKNPPNEKYYVEPYKKALRDFKKWRIRK